MKSYYCEVEEKKVSGKCLWEKNGITDKYNNKTCLQCNYFKEVISSQESKPRESKPQKSEPKSKPKTNEKEALRKWELAFRNPWNPKISKPFIMSQVAGIMGLKRLNKTARYEFLVCSWWIICIILREVREVMPMPRNRPRKHRPPGLPRRKTFNRPLHVLMTVLALFWEKWKRESVTRETEGFKKLVNYWLERRGLSKVWSKESIDGAVRIIISKALKDIRRVAKERGSPIAKFHLMDIIPYFKLKEDVPTNIVLGGRVA